MVDNQNNRKEGAAENAASFVYCYPQQTPLSAPATTVSASTVSTSTAQSISSAPSDNSPNPSHSRTAYPTKDVALTHLRQKHIFFETGYKHYYRINVFSYSKNSPPTYKDIKHFIYRTNQKLFSSADIRAKRADVVKADLVYEVGNKASFQRATTEIEKLRAAADGGYGHWHGILYCKQEETLPLFIEKSKRIAGAMKRKALKIDLLPLDESEGGLDGWLVYMCKMNRCQFDPEKEFIEL